MSERARTLLFFGVACILTALFVLSVSAYAHSVENARRIAVIEEHVLWPR